jgi:hypothetical protein
VFVLSGVTVLIGLASHAVPPAYQGRLGNYEEPALRPFKSFWQAGKAVVYQPMKSLKEGNQKTPLLGSAEAFHGLREGVIDGAEISAQGICGATAPKGQEYKVKGYANSALDDDIMMRNTADFAFGGGYMWGVQKVVDKYPVNNETERIEMERKAKLSNRERKANLHAKAEGESLESPIYGARRNYLGNRAEINSKMTGRGNLLKLAR